MAPWGAPAGAPWGARHGGAGEIRGDVDPWGPGTSDCQVVMNY